MILFKDKKVNQYVEIFHDENYRAIIRWVNYPQEIIYYNDSRDKHTYNHVVKTYKMFFKNCRDIMHARRILDNMADQEKITRTVEQVRELKNDAFDNMNSSYMANYWFGVFDALRWVLGDEVEEFDNV